MPKERTEACKMQEVGLKSGQAVLLVVLKTKPNNSVVVRYEYTYSKFTCTRTDLYCTVEQIVRKDTIHTRY